MKAEKLKIKASVVYLNPRITENEYVALCITITYPSGNETDFVLKLPEHQYNSLNKNQEFPIFPEHFMHVLAERINLYGQY